MALILASGGCSETRKPETALKGFAVVDVRTTRTATLEAYSGSPTIVTVWTTFCVTCATELPELDQLLAAQRERGLRGAAVSVDQTSPSVVAEFVKRLDIAMPVYHERTRALERQWRIIGVPTVVLFDRRGLTRRLVGPVDWSAPATLALVDSAMRGFETVAATR